MIKPKRAEDPPRVAAAAARKPVVPASSAQQQKPGHRGDAARPLGSVPSKKHSPSVAPAGPVGRSKGGGKSGKVLHTHAHTHTHTHTHSLTNVMYRHQIYLTWLAERNINL